MNSHETWKKEESGGQYFLQVKALRHEDAKVPGLSPGFVSVSSILHPAHPLDYWPSSTTGDTIGYLASSLLRPSLLCQSLSHTYFGKQTWRASQVFQLFSSTSTLSENI